LGQTEGVPEESFSVVSFRGLKPAVVCEGNCRSVNAEGQLRAMETGGSTPLYDSIVFASKRLSRAKDTHVRKILILLSDGADTISLSSFSEAMESASENDVAIYSVDISSKPHTARGTLALRNLSLNTGGRYFAVEAGTGKVIDAILEDFHATYTVAYRLPSRAAGFHQVRIVPTHNLSLQFHCRLGYYYPSNSGN
jgi:Ca-activated chloride channel homolog